MTKDIYSWEIGCSVKQVPILAWKIGEGKETIHFYGGFHGDEPEGIELALQLKDYLMKNAAQFLDKRLIVVPVVNPDGYQAKTRVNANKIDLNRNFPTKNWTSEAPEPKYNPGQKPNSEPEVQAMVKLIEDFFPQKIISFHSLIPHQLNTDGPAKALAEAMARLNGYPVTPNIGYPTPGSLGAYAGEERKIAMITYELPEKISSKKAWEGSLEAILEAIRFSL